MHAHSTLRPLFASTRHVLFLTIVGVAGVIKPGKILAQETIEAKQVDVRTLPKPNEKNQLFYLQRDPDRNTVIYQLNVAKDGLDPKKPIHPYWIRYEESDRRQDLSYVQRTFAYGVETTSLGNGEYSFQLVCYKNLTMRLTHSKKHGKYIVLATVNNKEVMLDNIFVRIDGGSLFNPNIEYIEFTGKEVSSGKTVTERLKP